MSRRRLGPCAGVVLDELLMAVRPWRAFHWRIWRHDAVAALPGLAPRNGLLAIFFPCRLRRDVSRNNKIARPAILRCAAGLKAAGRPSRP